MSYNATSPSFTVQRTDAGLVAIATFPVGLSRARRPVAGPAAADASSALAGLLASPLLLQALSSAVTPIDWGDLDA